jgi:hypothetical protein
MRLKIVRVFLPNGFGAQSMNAVWLVIGRGDLQGGVI